MSEMHQHEQDIGKGLLGGTPSVGLINIKDGPIRWINLIRTERTGGPHRNIIVTTYRMDYGVPLTVESKITKEWIFAVRLKRFPIFGPVTRIHWRGGGWGRKVTDQLNGDPLMGQPTVVDAGIELTCYPEHMCWIISTKENRWPDAKESRARWPDALEWRIPSPERWDAYQALARRLVTATQSHMQTLPAAF